MKRAILLSGGLDSLALAYWKRPDLALTIDYGQIAAEAEIKASKTFCEYLELPHEVLRIDCGNLGSGDLIQSTEHPSAPFSDWWPYRNQLLVTLAAMRLIHYGVTEILIGTVKDDASFGDGRKSFLRAFDRLLACQEGRIRLSAPARALMPLDLIRKSRIPLGLLALAHSCNNGTSPCGRCRSCKKNQWVFSTLTNTDAFAG
jgi:7-cyano-7-deazaguanine synthase